jgi:hypothetical protein
VVADALSFGDYSRRKLLKVISVAANPSFVIADPAKNGHSSSSSTKEICVKCKMVQSRHNISLLKLVFVLMLFLDALMTIIQMGFPGILMKGKAEGFPSAQFAQNFSYHR